MLTDKQEAFIHFEKNKLSDAWQDIINELLESEETANKISEIYDRLELSEVLLSECLEILTFLARKKDNQVSIKEAMKNTDLSNYVGGFEFDYEYDKGVNNFLKLLAKGLRK